MKPEAMTFFLPRVKNSRGVGTSAKSRRSNRATVWKGAGRLTLSPRPAAALGAGARSSGHVDDPDRQTSRSHEGTDLPRGRAHSRHRAAYGKIRRYTPGDPGPWVMASRMRPDRGDELSRCLFHSAVSETFSCSNS